MKRDFKVGDKVWHPEYGWGDITIMLSGGVAKPYKVCFKDKAIWYGWCGWWELFYDEVELPNPLKPKPEIDWTKVPIGTRVIVWDLPEHEKDRCFIAYEPDKSSPFWTVSPYNNAVGWKHCRIHPDVEIKEEWLKK